ncbi:uncharacterized protein TRUGW13939_02199 [Talaromyces rugulosus]|uniref:Apple domain-containing protein n=1 Tax=Talaromyces rugulosus TaxID=121627 RepID=A0A7H8QMF5_TALRU|nr:uncharacterized protein TRUGW13939_02199 [Talaromyces rugulosus]QKX55107.1 hypothetical protein TRUGW13939_02199 [Talaromyces rugulosus]
MKRQILGSVVGLVASFSGLASSKSLLPSTSLHARDDSSTCPEPSYVADNGLEFDTSCGIDFLFTELAEQTEPTMANCMDSCSEYQPPCYGVTYYTQNQTCSFKGIGINSSFASTSDADNVDVNSALANVTQMLPLDTACPFQNNSNIPTANELSFHILCGQDMGGYGDYLPWTILSRAHTDTMIDCMDLCSHAHPLCLGVSWNPDLTAGYGNCYLKNTQDGGVPFTPTNYVAHSALVTMPIIGACSPTALPAQITSDKKEFDVSCFGARAGSNNFTSVYSQNITGCIDQCAAYGGPESCIGVYYDNSFVDGYENCYMLDNIGSETVPKNSTYAELVSGDPSGSTSTPVTSTVPSPTASSTSTSTSASTSSSGGSSSKAWIAGPAIGGVAAVVIVFAGFFWWRRRQIVPDEKKFAPIYQSSQVDSPGLHELPRYPVSEMDARESRHELPS